MFERASRRLDVLSLWFWILILGKEVFSVKKFIAMLLVGAVMFTSMVTLTGCGDGKEKPKTDKPKEEKKAP